MDINYNNRYAYAEVYTILEWLGDEYKRKVPKNLLKLFKDERKFGYTPKIDFEKPLETQIRQETINIIGYLQYSCWLEDPNEKEKLKNKIEENVKKRKEQEKLEREERRKMAGNAMNVPLNAQVDKALQNLNNK